MSEENVEIVRKVYEAMVRRDTDAIDALMREHMAPDFEFESVLTGKTHEGPQGIRDLWEDLWDTVDYVPATEEIIDLGEHIVIVLRISGHGMRSGVPVVQQVAILITLEGDRAVRGKSFTSKAEALTAAGWSE